MFTPHKLEVPLNNCHGIAIDVEIGFPEGLVITYKKFTLFDRARNTKQAAITWE